MEVDNSNDVNLFADSDNERNTNNWRDISRKRRYVDTDRSKTLEKELPVKSNNDSDTFWSIEDDTLFYPLGICTHYIPYINKSVILIWSDLSVINFVIKKNMKTKQTKTTRVRINVPNGEKIKEIKILELNTLLLLESGRVNFFSSAKSMHTLSWLADVRCITKAPEGFSVIRLNKKRLVLEVYEDLIGMGKQSMGSLKHQYDITFDEQNLFNCSWKHENYCLISTAISEGNFKFLQTLTRNVLNLEHKKELHIFTVSGNVFLLVPDIDDINYHIEMLFSYSSSVATVKLDFERKFCFIFLQCGLIDIWYESRERQYLRHHSYSIGAEHTSFSYSDSRAAFYFTDESQVAELKFHYKPESDNIALQETYKAIPGILCCTWIEAIEQLLCLDCNNIFHELSFEPTTKNDSTQSMITAQDYEKFNTLFELTPERVAQLLEKAHILQELNELPKVLYQSIEQEFQKQQILTIVEQRMYYSSLLKARLEFSCNPFDNTQKDVIALYTQTHFMLSHRSILALIYVDIEDNDIFENTLWQLFLQFEDVVHVFTVPKKLLRSKLCLVVPLEIRPVHLLPTFRLHLYTFVSCTSNFLAIALPISIVINANTYAKLFKLGNFDLFKNLQNNCNLINLLVPFNSQSNLVNPNEVQCCLTVPKKFKLNTFIDMLPIEKTSPQTNSILLDENSFEFNFLGSQISVCYNPSTNVLITKTNDTVALFYLKMYLQLVCENNQVTCHAMQLKGDHQKILRYQCNIERLFGTLQASCVDELNENPSIAQKLKNLKELYAKVRKELNYPFL